VNFKQRESGLLVPRYPDGMRVRDRVAPPAKVGARMEGRIHYQLVDREGKIVDEGESHNLVLDAGLDLVASHGLGQGIFAYCVVGTGSTAPAATDTGLVAELTRTNTTWQGDSTVRTSNGVYDISRYFEFTYGAANGNLTEFGFSPNSAAGANLFSRALFRDGGGSPKTITKTSSEKLRVNYTLTVTLTPVVMTAGSFNIANIGTITGNYMLLGYYSDGHCANPDLGTFNALAQGIGTLAGGIYELTAAGGLQVDSNDASGLAYATAPPTSGTRGTLNAHGTASGRDAYTPGSHQRTGGSWFFDTDYGDIAIEAFYIGGRAATWNSGINLCGALGYVFDLDAGMTFTKDNLHTLTIGAPTVSWSR